MREAGGQGGGRLTMMPTIIGKDDLFTLNIKLLNRIATLCNPFTTSQKGAIDRVIRINHVFMENGDSSLHSVINQLKVTILVLMFYCMQGLI